MLDIDGCRWVNNISLFVKGTPFLTFTDSAANQCLGRVQSVGTIYPTFLFAGEVFVRLSIEMKSKK